MIVFSFTCGHIGRTNSSPLSKTQGFIRVAEIRKDEKVSNPSPCPDCKSKEYASAV